MSSHTAGPGPSRSSVQREERPKCQSSQRRCDHRISANDENKPAVDPADDPNPDHPQRAEPARVELRGRHEFTEPVGAMHAMAKTPGELRRSELHASGGNQQNRDDGEHGDRRRGRVVPGCSIGPEDDADPVREHRHEHRADKNTTTSQHADHACNRQRLIPTAEGDSHDSHRSGERDEEHSERHDSVIRVVLPGDVVGQDSKLFDGESKHNEQSRHHERPDRSPSELPPTRITDLDRGA